MITAYNIHPYIPYIKEIFPSSLKNHLKISNSQKENQTKQNVVSTIQNLLKVKYNRFQCSWVLSILNSKLLRKKFSIKSQDLQTLYTLVTNLNGQFGFDEKHFKKMFLPNIRTSSWSYAINRITLSFWLKKSHSIWNNISTPNSLSYKHSILLGNFVNLILELNKLRKTISYKKTLTNWSKIISKIINVFFEVPVQHKKFFFKLTSIWKKIISEGINLFYLHKISIDTLLERFFKQSSLLFTKNHFMSGRINILNLNHITCTPFKMICIIGCNQDQKKKNKINIFDKISKKNNNNYKNIFFDTIMLAKKYLFFSYLKTITDGKKIYLLSNLQDILFYLSNRFDNLYKIYPKNKNQLKTSYSKYLKPQTIKKKIKNTLTNKCIQLTELINFWKNPISYFFKHTLNIKINKNFEKQLPKEELFDLNPLDKYKINKQMLHLALLKKQNKTLFQKYKLRNKLPQSNVGKILWRKEEKKIYLLSKKINQIRHFPHKIKINLKLKKYHLSGLIKEINTCGLIHWSVSKIKYTHIIATWIEHIIHCILYTPQKSILLGINNSIIEFSPLTPKKAQKYLKMYIQGYLDGTKKPILVLKSGMMWLYSVYVKKNNTFKKDQSDLNVAKKNFFKIWTDNSFYKGENSNIYVQKLIPEMNSVIMKKICNTAKYWFLPVLKNTNLKKNHII